MKKARLVGLVLIIIFIFITAGYLVNRFSYAKELPFYSVNVKKDSVLTIGIIGDSWVAGKKLDSVIHYTLLANKINNKVFSSGQGGAKSKIIYQNLFKKKTDLNSSKNVIENRPDYCIVIAGVNDALGQVGKEFYTHHLIMIIKTLLHYNIKPIVVELPEIGIIEATDQMGFFKKGRNIIYAYFTDAGELDNIYTYRNELKKMLLEQHLNNSIIYIDFNRVCTNYKECLELYVNPSHLSRRGNIKLGKIIANDIIKNH
ncbi:MAG: SGNH/GDSL hydrolase family protein [Janthinobacterium lividum]